MTVPQRLNNPALGIGLITIAITAITMNDMLIKWMSDAYPLHQMVLIRSCIALVISLVLVQIEGGWHILKTRRPGLHLIRALMLVVANLSFFAAIASLPLADATAIGFVAPLIVTLLSLPILGEKVGPLRIGAVIVGFVGVLIVIQPWQGEASRDAPFVVYLLPLVAATAYALNSVLTRLLGDMSKASAMAVYIQVTFLVVSLCFWTVVGDGRLADRFENESLVFLLRAWVWPEPEDYGLLLLLGFNAGIIGYTVSAAYRMADAATIAPFEYIGLPMAILWGWLIFGELPGSIAAFGIALIIGSDLFVFFRERQKERKVLRGGRLQERE